MGWHFLVIIMYLDLAGLRFSKEEETQSCSQAIDIILKVQVVTTAANGTIYDNVIGIQQQATV